MINNIIVAAVAFFLGYYCSNVLKILKKIEKRLQTLRLVQKKQEEEDEKPQATFAEPMTSIELAAQEERDKLKRLNPTLYDD